MLAWAFNVVIVLGLEWCFGLFGWVLFMGVVRCFGVGLCLLFSWLGLVWHWFGFGVGWVGWLFLYVLLVVPVGVGGLTVRIRGLGGLI